MCVFFCFVCLLLVIWYPSGKALVNKQFAKPRMRRETVHHSPTRLQRQTSLYLLCDSLESLQRAVEERQEVTWFLPTGYDIAFIVHVCFQGRCVLAATHPRHWNSPPPPMENSSFFFFLTQAFLSMSVCLSPLLCLFLVFVSQRVAGQLADRLVGGS